MRRSGTCVPVQTAQSSKSGVNAMISLGCGTVSFRNLPLEEALERIARAGYTWVETQATAPFCPHVDPWLPALGSRA